MKIAHASYAGQELWGLVDIETTTITPVVGTLAEWAPDIVAGATSLRTTGEPVPLADVTFLPPITRSSTIVAVGLNYWAHMEKLGVTQRPASPQGFVRPYASMIGHEQPIRYPGFTAQLDFEIELVAVIGRDLDGGERPTESVLGYTVGNDMSARDAVSPMGGPDLFTMKALGGAVPLGPWITTKDELGGSGQLDLEILLRVNGEVRQSDRTRNMLWSIDECLSYVLERFPLRAGDVLFTGTTSGVAAEDGRWLAPGDVVDAEIEGIGVLRNIVGPRP